MSNQERRDLIEWLATVTQRLDNERAYQGPGCPPVLDDIATEAKHLRRTLSNDAPRLLTAVG